MFQKIVRALIKVSASTDNSDDNLTSFLASSLGGLALGGGGSEIMEVLAFTANGDVVAGKGLVGREGEDEGDDPVCVVWMSISAAAVSVAGGAEGFLTVRPCIRGGLGRLLPRCWRAGPLVASGMIGKSTEQTMEQVKG